jgi:hypothetical protein
MLIAEQITALILAAFSLFFMLWFLAGTIHDSANRFQRHARPSSQEADSWPVESFSPPATSPSASSKQTASKAPQRPQPQYAPKFTHSLWPHHTPTR